MNVKKGLQTPKTLPKWLKNFPCGAKNLAMLSKSCKADFCS